MDIMELGAIGELVGGVAVIASLLYVGLQVRQSTEQARQSNAIERAQAGREAARDFNDLALAMTDPDFMLLLRKATADFGGLPRNDQARLHNWLSTRVTHTVSILQARRDGLMEEEFAEIWIRALAAWVATPGIQQWWTQFKPSSHQDVVAEVERINAASDPPISVHEIWPWFALGDGEAES
jgi:hypothetical protein